MRRVIFSLAFLGNLVAAPDLRLDRQSITYRTKAHHYHAVEYSADLSNWVPQVIGDDTNNDRDTLLNLTQLFPDGVPGKGFLRLREVEEDSTSDIDDDDLPDWWELKYQTGYLTPNRDENPDGDENSNFQEFENGTDPTALDITNEAELQEAVSNQRDGMKLSLAPGTYTLTSTLVIRKNNVSIIGATGNPAEVILKGAGMDNSAIPHGIFTDAIDLKVSNLTIREVYFHAIQLSPGSESPQIRNVHMIDIGEQFIKGNSAGFGEGTDDGLVENCRMEYTNGPPTIDHGGGIGYTNGVDIHGGKNWIIRNNVFKNFHKADHSTDQSNYWNPAVLMWNGARDTLCENNTFINVDRAIAFGLGNRSGDDHRGGIIRNNMVYMSPGLYSESRHTNSDGTIIVWDSPGTQVLHNTILTNGNTNLAIEFRFDATGCTAANNLTDGIIRSRGPAFTAITNLTNANPDLFIDPPNGNLRLQAVTTNQVAPFLQSLYDIDGHQRNSPTNPGAHQFQN